MSTFNTADVKNAILDCVLDRYNNIPAENEIEYTFSQKFEKWAQKLIKKTPDQTIKTNTRFSGRTLKIAIIVAAIIAMLSATAMAVPAIREAILDFFLSDRGESYGITFDPEQAANAPKSVEEYRIPQYIPEDFFSVLDEKNVAGIDMAWMNDADEILTYHQTILRQDATKDDWIGFNAEGVERSSVIICGYQVEILQDIDIYTAIWTDNEYSYFMEISNSISLETLWQIINSITAIQ